MIPPHMYLRADSQPNRIQEVLDKIQTRAPLQVQIHLRITDKAPLGWMGWSNTISREICILGSIPILAAINIVAHEYAHMAVAFKFKRLDQEILAELRAEPTIKDHLENWAKAYAISYNCMLAGWTPNKQSNVDQLDMFDHKSYSYKQFLQDEGYL